MEGTRVNGELLIIEPSNLKFPIVLKEQTSCSFQLSNQTDNYVAFKVQSTNPKEYCSRPNAGIVLPRSTCGVIVTRRALEEAPADMQCCRDVFLLKSAVASLGTTPYDITEEMFNKEAGKLVEECELRIIFVTPPQMSSQQVAECSSSRSLIGSKFSSRSRLGGRSLVTHSISINRTFGEENQHPEKYFSSTTLIGLFSSVKSLSPQLDARSLLSLNHSASRSLAGKQPTRQLQTVLNTGRVFRKVKRFEPGEHPLAGGRGMEYVVQKIRNLTASPSDLGRENVPELNQQVSNLIDQMKDLSRFQYDSKFLKQTRDEIRTILWEAEDAIDSYRLQAAVPNSRDWASTAFHQMSYYDMVFKDVERRIAEVGNKVEKFKQEMQYQAIDNFDRPARYPPKAARVEEDRVIGFDKAALDILGLLTGGPDRLEVISIVGMLGLGKTTLAKMIYKNLDLDSLLMIRAFVYVSKEFDKREMLLQILACFTKTDDEVRNMNEEQLENHIYQYLERKPYLIVLDDVCLTKDWDRLKNVFPSNQNRSRILITTRNVEVAEYVNPRNPDSMYWLDFLRQEESRELLKWKVFQEKGCSAQLEDFEIQIVEKCNGLPLAIVVIAGIISNHPKKVDWWRHVASCLKDHNGSDETRSTKVIELMYEHLPNYLKPCFLYLGVFRENFEIPVWKLLRLWISEDLIQNRRNSDLEDIAEQYLEELVQRSLLVVGQRRSNYRIKTCFIYSELHQFCKKEAAKENHFQEIKIDNLSFLSSGDPNLDQYRRFCINNANIWEHVSGNPSGKRIRSFLTFVKDGTQLEPKLISRIPETFKLLKVFEIQSLVFKDLPVDLCHLVLLKYLAISGSFSSLPSALSSLWKLQTLIVSTTSNALEIEADLSKMLEFRHLHTNSSTKLQSPNNKTPNENLQTLCTISPQSCQKQVLDWTPKLKKLGIRGSLVELFKVSQGQGSLFDNLCSSKELRILKLKNDNGTSKQPLNLPSEKSFPKQLTKLTLVNTFLEWDEMSTLGKLENLETLKLGEFAFRGRLWHTKSGGFLYLNHLHIGQMDLVVWEAQAYDFPMLESLELNGCDKLRGVPYGLADIPSLQSVVLRGTNSEVANSFRRFHVEKLVQATRVKKQNFFKVSAHL